MELLGILVNIAYVNLNVVYTLRLGPSCLQRGGGRVVIAKMARSADINDVVCGDSASSGWPKRKNEASLAKGVPVHVMGCHA
jgi:hypothetical protein